MVSGLQKTAVVFVCAPVKEFFTFLKKLKKLKDLKIILTKGKDHGIVLYRWQ
jgi:hypothetical protein